MTLPSENLGKVDNTGFEAVAFYKDSKGDFSWNVSANVTYARNKVVYMDEAVKTVAWQRVTGHSMMAIHFIMPRASIRLRRK